MTTDLSGQEYNSRHGMFPTIDAGNSYVGLFKFVTKAESFCHWIYKTCCSQVWVKFSSW